MFSSELIAKKGLCTALLVLLGACAVGPDYKAPELVAPADWKSWHGGAGALSELPARQGSAELPDWKGFGDPVLDRLLDELERGTPDLVSASLRFAQSRAQRLTVTAQRGPKLDARGGATRQKISENGNSTRSLAVIAPGSRDALAEKLADPYSLYQAGFDASWEIDLWGRVRRSVEAADASVAANEASLAEVKLALGAELARHYFELRAAQEQLRLAREQIAASEETLSMVRAQQKSGLVNALTLSQQEALLADQRSRLPQLEAQEAQASNQITLLLGKRPGSLKAELADVDKPASVEALPELKLGLPGELARRRPDIRRAEAELHSAVASVGVATADLYPRVVLGASFGLESTTSNKFGEWGSSQWSVGPSLSLPLFDQGRRRATIRLRELQQQEAAVALQKTVLRAWHEVDDSLNAYSAELLRHAQLVAKTRSSREAYALARARTASGLADSLVELDARRTLLQAQRDEVESTSRLFIDLVAIRKALGLAQVGS
ncbi:efflux transporter outer membrane subunit [Niveibacterium terrae]|uniref:efflux transporter outer membrane subunit n=1 Tax=Niveibacterium terrae TaxID=3373598 RepID=UPI003A91736D